MCRSVWAVWWIVVVQMADVVAWVCMVLLVVILLAMAVVLVAGVLDIFGFVDLKAVRERRRFRRQLREFGRDDG